jgi:hypothetical protein
MAERLVHYFIWLGGFVVLTGLITAMISKRQRQAFPWFFQYAIYQAAIIVLHFAVYHFGNYASYFYVYWTTAAIGTILAFCVLHEIFTLAFKPYPALQQLGSLLFRWGALVVLIFAFVMAVSNTASTVNALTDAILTLERSIRLMQCGMVLLLLFFSRHLGLNFRHRVFGIAIGFGTVAAINLILVSLRSGGWLTSDTAFSLIITSVYASAVVAWTGYMLAPEPARRPVLAEPVSARWDSALAGLAGGSSNSNPGDDALLLRMEAAVDRAFARPGNKVFIRSSLE